MKSGIAVVALLAAALLGFLLLRTPGTTVAGPGPAAVVPAAPPAAPQAAAPAAAVNPAASTLYVPPASPVPQRLAQPKASAGELAESR